VATAQQQEWEGDLSSRGGRSTEHSLCVPGHGGPVHAEASPHGATGSRETGITASLIDSAGGGDRRYWWFVLYCSTAGALCRPPLVARERDRGMAFETVRQKSNTLSEVPSTPCKAGAVPIVM
jgi:hypothetical protein